MAMRSTILAARINRAIETEGAIGDGASLANIYAEAVQAVNLRLDAVVSAIEAKQVSDAVRVMEDAPRLLDEVNALDFQRLPDWEVVCERHGWTRPPKIDKAQLERVLMLNEDAAATETFLRMYRKAVRANDQRLAVQSLRHLVRNDSTQNWKGNLAQAEASLQNQISADFEKARKSGDDEAAERIARDFLAEPWTEPPTSKKALAIKAYVEELNAAERAREGEENLSILRKCQNGEWSLDLAFSMLQAVDRLVEAGWAIPPADKALVESCRMRCGDEMEAKEREARWHELCGELHTAVQKEDAEAIRNVLSSPEFLDREPEEDLLRQAQLVIEHEEAARKRKMVQITVCVVAALVAFLGISYRLFKNKLFNDRVESEVAKLETLGKAANPIERLKEGLARLERNDPEVYADPRVNVFDGKLKTLIAENEKRTNEIVSVIGELGRLMDMEWKEATTDSVTGRIARVRSLLKDHDNDYWRQIHAIESSWGDYTDKSEATMRTLAERSSDVLINDINRAAEGLNTKIADAGVAAAAEKCHEEVKDWRGKYAEDSPDIEARIAAAERLLADAEANQKNVIAALQALKTATNALDIVSAHEALRQNYGAYGDIAEMNSLPYAAEDVSAILDDSAKEMAAYAANFEYGISREEFESFVKDQIVEFKEFAVFYSLYGVYATVWYRDVQHRDVLLAIAREKPSIGKSASYKDKLQIEGDLIDLTRGNEGQSKSTVECWYDKQIKTRNHTENPVSVLMATSEEIRNLVDVGMRQNLTIEALETEILRLVDYHIGAAKQKSYLATETADGNTYVRRGTIPATRRVQLLKMYMDWLNDDLKLMPDMPWMKGVLQSLTNLSQPVMLDGVPEDMRWACLYDKRVREWNRKCANYLANNIPADLVARYREAQRARRTMGELARMKVRSAGKVNFDPTSDPYKRDKRAIVPMVRPDMNKDHPLYVLRKEKDRLVLKKALVPVNGRMAIATKEMKEDFVLGEPLFEVVIKDAPIDAEAKVAELLKSLPAALAGQYAAKIPYFKAEAK